MERIPVFSPWIDFEDFESVNRALNLGWISGTSPIVEEFEDAIAHLSDRKYVAAVSNGSVALDLAFEALKLSPGDEVILPNFTIISCLAAVVRTGAKPILIDVDPITWNMRLEDVEAAYSSKTKAVLVVHIYGLPSPVDHISEFCRKNGIFLIEDAAEAHGIKVSGQPCGSFGDVSTFSFYANKHVTAGEGGAVCTNSEEQYSRIISMRNLAFGKKNRFQHEEFGWNYRLGGLASALGISQLTKLSRIIALKKIQGATYNQLLSNASSHLQLPAPTANGSENNFWVYGIVCEDESSKSRLVRNLEKNGVESRPFFYPLSEQPAFKKLEIGLRFDVKNSLRLGSCGIYIPTGSHIDASKQQRISEVILSSF
jgi:perosamine synthetase